MGLDAAISATKGCYVGQEIVARLRTYGRVNRRLVGFRFPEGPVAAGTVFPDREKPSLERARVTSSVESPRFGPIGLGLAFHDVGEGARLSLPGASGAVAASAIVCGLPFA
jgi:folate-binding Fe-S cluster repair protein YgfZ